MTQRIAAVLAIALAAALLGLGGCASAPKQTPLMDEMGITDATVRELRLRVYDLGISFSAQVEHAADGIMAAADDPVIQRRALLWKVNATTVMNQAVFQIDPLAAIIDANAIAPRRPLRTERSRLATRPRAAIGGAPQRMSRRAAGPARSWGHSRSS